MSSHRRMSPALVVALLALFVSLTGTGYAALKLPRNSVTTIQVKDRSLLAKDFKRGQLPAGPQGPAGPTGATGSTGPAGAAGPQGPTGANGATNVTVRTSTKSIVPGPPDATNAVCQGNERATGGGASYTGTLTISQSYPFSVTSTAPPTGWTAWASTSTSGTITVYAVCAAP